MSSRSNQRLSARLVPTTARPLRNRPRPAQTALSPEPDIPNSRITNKLSSDPLSDACPCPAIVLDLEGRISAHNEQFATLLGAKRRDTLANSFSIYVQPDSLGDYLRHLRECFRSRRSHSVAIKIHALGSDVPISIRLFTVFDEKPDVTSYRVVIVDDTDRQMAVQDALREHQAYLELVDSLDAIVWEMDAKTGKTTFLSKKAELLFGALVHDWQSERRFRWTQLHVDDRERVLNELARAVALRKDFVTEYRMFTVERKLIWLQDSITSRIVDGSLRLRGVAVDITERKRTEERTALATEELEQRVEQRTAELTWTISELESFSYTLSHDMRAPLRSIEGYASMVAAEVRSKAPATTMECLQRIRQSAQRLDALVQDVLKYSSVAKAPIELKSLDLNALIPAIATEALGFDKKSGTRIDVAKKMLPVMGHPGFLSQCLNNLLSNAAKFAAPDIPPRVRIWTEARDESVRIFVEDNGIGIAPADHVRIFKAFERCHRQLKIDGAGLGLAIVQRAAGRMGGSVGVESTQGKGSKFWIELRGVATG